MSSAGLRMVAAGLLLAAVELLFPNAGAANRQDQVQPSVSELLVSAQALYEATDLEDAEKPCNQIIEILTQLRKLAPLNPSQRKQLAMAYELRGLAWYGRGKKDLAGQDFTAVLEAVPSYSMRQDITVNKDHRALFDSVKKQMVGTIKFEVEPWDAEVRIDGDPVEARPEAQPIEKQLLAGVHTVTASKIGFVDATNKIEVTADIVASLPLKLERRTASTFKFSGEAGVAVRLNGNPMGETNAEGKLEFSVSAGEWKVDYSAPCSKPSSEPRTVRPDEYQVVEIPVKLEKAPATVRISGDGGTVYFDTKPIGQMPLPRPIEDCAGPHVIEVRTDRGRSWHRVVLSIGENQPITAKTRPAVAILAASGQQTILGDLRVLVEDALQSNDTTLTLFAPAIGDATDWMVGQPVESGWLDFDLSGREASTPAMSLGRDRRQAISAKLAAGGQGVMDVQGVAEVKQIEPRKVLLTVLAVGSARPDVIAVNLDDPSAAIARLSEAPELFEMSVGLQVADVRDIVGAVVVRSLWVADKGKAYPERGDIIEGIRGADGKLFPVKDVSSFVEHLGRMNHRDLMVLDVKRSGGERIPIGVMVERRPRLIGLDDQTVLANKRVLDFNLAVLEKEGDEQTVARLNLAVALMKVEDWPHAIEQLEQVKFESDLQVAEGAPKIDRPGVSNGTVHYLRGVCLEKLQRRTEAIAAYEAALKVKGALLTGDGPPISELARARLDDMNGK